MKPIIRFATKKDAAAIAQVHTAAWQNIYRGIIPDQVLDNLSVDYRTQLWRKLLAEKLQILLIEQASELIGFVCIGPSRDEDTNQSICGEISAIYLDPKFWRQGFGKQLFAAALDKLYEMGFKEIIVWVVVENTQARKFYEAMGFRETNTHKTEIISTCTGAENSEVTVKEIRYLKDN